MKRNVFSKFENETHLFTSRMSFSARKHAAVDIACAHGWVHAVRVLLDEKHASMTEMFGALQIGCSNGHFGICKEVWRKLVPRLSDQSDIFNTFHWSLAFEEACRKGCWPIVDWMVSCTEITFHPSIWKCAYRAANVHILQQLWEGRIALEYMGTLQDFMALHFDSYAYSWDRFRAFQWLVNRVFGGTDEVLQLTGVFPYLPSQAEDFIDAMWWIGITLPASFAALPPHFLSVHDCTKDIQRWTPLRRAWIAACLV